MAAHSRFCPPIIPSSSITTFRSQLSTINRNFIAIVKDKEEATFLQQEFEVLTNTKYIRHKTKGSFSKSGAPETGNIQFISKHAGFTIVDDGVPFLIIGSTQFECQHGVDRDTKKKENYRDSRKKQYEEDPESVPIRNQQKAKKLGCKAEIYVIETKRFPKYNDRIKTRQQIINMYVTNREEFCAEAETRIYILFPSLDEHTGHPVGKNADMMQCIDKQLIEKINQLIKDDPFMSVIEVKEQLEAYVKNELDITETTSRRFFPLQKDIANHVYIAKQKQTVEGDEKMRELNTVNHTCYICDKAFSMSSSLYRHIRKIHKAAVHFPSRKVVCPLCDANSQDCSIEITNYTKYNEHLEQTHGLRVENEIHRFKSLNDFEDWKVKMEHATCSQYVKSRGAKRSNSFEKIHYICNRSGFYESEGAERRRLKTQGSCKMNASCPSRIRVTRNCKTDFIEVEFISTHVGHDKDVSHLLLTKQERDWVANKLKEGIDGDDLLEMVRNSTNGEHTRLQLLNKKDIFNIKSAYGIDGEKKVSTDKNDLVVGDVSEVKTDIGTTNDVPVLANCVLTEDGENVCYYIIENLDGMNLEVMTTSVNDTEQLRSDILKHLELTMQNVKTIDDYETLSQIFNNYCKPMHSLTETSISQ